MRVDLTGQAVERNAIAPKFQKLKQLLVERRDIWDRIPVEKRVKWVESGKDPIMSFAYDAYKWLGDNFFGPKKLGNAKVDV